MWVDRSLNIYWSLIYAFLTWIYATFLIFTKKPSMLSSLALSVEDASALGVLLSHITSRSVLPTMLAGFQEIRQPICDLTAGTERGWFKMLSLPPGPEREARDAQMRATRDLDREPTEEELREHWENLGTYYTHDATEAAEDWWAKWGRLSIAGSQK
jgi:salicylate hydroxylase